MKLPVPSFLLAAALLVHASAFPAHNPAVQPLFFDDLHAALPAHQPRPVATSGAAVEVSWAGLAWEVENVKTTHVPLVIEFYSADPRDCMRLSPINTDECTPQAPQFTGLAGTYAGRVKFVRFNVQQHPALVNGPDVRVLPAHIFIADYTDSQHYTAIKIWGLLDRTGLQAEIYQMFQIAP